MRKQVLLTLDVSKWPDDAVNLIENRIYTMPWVEWIAGQEMCAFPECGCKVEMPCDRGLLSAELVFHPEAK